jgi:hypothetical protein
LKFTLFFVSIAVIGYGYWNRWFVIPDPPDRFDIFLSGFAMGVSAFAPIGIAGYWVLRGFAKGQSTRPEEQALFLFIAGVGMGVGWFLTAFFPVQAQWIENVFSFLGYVAVGLLGYSSIKLIIGLFQLALGKRRDTDDANSD